MLYHKLVLFWKGELRVTDVPESKLFTHISRLLADIPYRIKIMTHYIENEHLKIGVKTFGCELSSICSKDDNHEYLWQGDESIWYGQSPILFPIVGRLIDDKYTLNGKEYEMPKHGFARKSEWEFVSSNENTMTFRLCETEDTLKIYPYKFEFSVTYTLDGKKLTVTHTVKNNSNSVMYFSLGAHPAFNCEIGDKLVFDEKETLETEKIDLQKSLRLPCTFPVLKDETDLVITKDIFKEDALIFHGVKSENVTLKCSDRSVRFNLGGAPYLGIWAKPGAPYVCIEPWFGVNDSQEKKADFSQKDAIENIPVGEKFSFSWSAEFSK